MLVARGGDVNTAGDGDNNGNEIDDNGYDAQHGSDDDQQGHEQYFYNGIELPWVVFGHQKDATSQRFLRVTSVFL